MDSHIEFKRKIDNARNILVGAVPSPAGQIDQITYALIYKFMSDIDDKSARLPGGTRQYFVGEYEKYDWHNLMRLDGQDKLNRYRDALSAMSKNEHLPEIFRSIYQNAFLPYNDPRTLNLFLKEVDGFVHTKSDAIGDAYEYLLSITGAQGDVGQFRTPRHIIKFIVDVVQPGKDDTVLDPACGTAGFLIAAYNYVRMQHDGVGEDGEQNGEQRLTADERKKLHGNYYGFDIDPTMVRTATVNMYLHGFSTPNIEIHDTLTSEEHWQNRYDVILANPPFMTPKGGIQPHGKFGVKANRAEVLFVDYIASHLKPNGRAGIIVPEGIIFQSGNAYKDLRKSLVENSLYAVISLPSGVFNPYAGVKTSILLLDKELAAKNDEILFVKIENDGYSLGAQRRKITGGQFPEALEVIERFKNGEELQTEFAHVVKREIISESGDYNLSGDRYAPQVSRSAGYENVRLEDIFLEIKNGKNVQQSDEVGKYRVSRIQTIAAGAVNLNATKWTNDDVKEADLLRKGDILFSHINSYEHLAKTALFDEDAKVVHGANLLRLRPDQTKIVPGYASYVFKSDIFRDNARRYAQRAVNQASINSTSIKGLEIPLPPIEIQREIVAEIDGYQKIIDAAQTIIKTYKPTIKINPEWEVAKTGDVAEFIRGITFSSKDKLDSEDSAVLVATTKAAQENGIRTKDLVPVHPDKVKKEKSYLQNGDLLISVANSANLLGRRTFVMGLDSSKRYSFGAFMGCLRPNKEMILPEYMTVFFGGDRYKEFCLTRANTTTNISNLNWSDLQEFTIPHPSIEIQREIVAELEAEQQLINANKKLIEVYQQKIKSKIAEIWGE